MATFTTAITEKPYFLQAASGDNAISYSAADFRGLVGSIFGRVGITTPQSFNVLQDSPVGWSIVVSPGYARVAGSYLVRSANPVTVNLSSINKNPSSTRTHKVWVAVYDKIIDGNEYTAKVVVTEDTNGSGAPEPANAAGALQLATFVVNGGQSFITQSNINNATLHTWMGTSPQADQVNIKPGYYDSYASIGCSPVRAIYHNGQVSLRGALNRTNDAVFTGGNVYTPFSVDSVIRPAFDAYGICAARITNAEDFYCRFQLTTAGQCNVRIPSGYNPTTIFLDGFTYFLD